MDNKQWNPDKLPSRDYFKLLISQSILDDLLIRLTDSILELGIIEGEIARELARRAPKGSVLSMALKEHALEEVIDEDTLPDNVTFKQLTSHRLDYNESFDIICSFMFMHNLIDDRTIFSDTYHALKPGGRLFLVFPSGGTTTVKTFKEVLQSESYPGVKPDTHLYDVSIADEVQKLLMNLPFTDVDKIQPHLEIELPCLETFREYLHDISFMHRKVLPAHLVEEVIDKQVSVFDAFCQETYDGKYIFHATPFLLIADK